MDKNHKLINANVVDLGSCMLIEEVQYLLRFLSWFVVTNTRFFYAQINYLQ